MFALISAELFKVRERKISWVLLAVLVGFLVLYFFLSYYVVLNSPQPSESSRELLQFPGAFKLIFSTTQDIGTLLMVILTAFMIGDEYRWGTVRQMMVCVGDRFQYLGAKIISLLIIIILISFISLIVGTIFASFTTSALGDLNLDFITLSLIGEIGRMFGGTVLALVAFALLTLLLREKSVPSMN